MAVKSLKTEIDEFCANASNYLKVIHINAQSLTYQCHIDEFVYLFDGSSHDIITVSETFYNSGDDVIQINGYNSFFANRTSHEGGGVAVYVKNSLRCRILAQSISPQYREQRPDYIILEISFNTVKIIVACVYRPPKAGHVSFFQDELFSLCSDYEYVIVTGDVNAHFGSLKPCDLSDAKAILELLETCNLTRVPFGPTFHQNNCESTLDMVASTCPDKLISFIQRPAGGFSAHDLLYAVYDFLLPKFQPTTITRRDFSKLDVDLLQRDILAAPWEKMLDYISIDDKVTVFNEILTNVYDKYAPLKTISIKHQPKPWFTPELKSLISQRETALARSRRTKKDCDIKAFKKVRNLVNRVKRDLKIKYAYSILKSEDMWQALRKLDVAGNKPPSCSFPPAQDLNTHYASVSCLDIAAVDKNIQYYESLPPLVDECFHFSDVTFPDLLKAVNSVKSNAMGVDNISIKMLKTCIVELSPPILHLFNYSLQSCSFPSLWKVAKIKPLPKKIGASALKDFRPISILCILGKILEKIVHSQMSVFLSHNNILHPFQSGFKAGHSTTTALLKVTGDIREAMGKRLISLLVLYDFSNAFPSVHHGLLLSKLHHLGLSISAINWISSYLTGRQQFVNLDSEVSDLIDVLFGVPQGSVLGPLLYSLYVNDIGEVFGNSNFHLYADDLQNYLSFPTSDLSNAVSTINAEALKLIEYSNGHNLSINSSKTQVILIGNPKLLQKLPASRPSVAIDGNHLPYLDSVNNLGVIIDSNLSWEQYATSVCNKSRSVLHRLRKHRDILPMAVRKRLVESLVFPILDYGAVVTFGMPVKSCLRLQRVQNACVRFVLDLPWDASISCYYSVLNWLNISQRKNYHSLCLLFKVRFYMIPSYLFCKITPVDSVCSRDRRDTKPALRLPLHLTDKERGAFWISAVILWNQLPECILVLRSLCSFKHKVRDYILTHVLVDP